MQMGARVFKWHSPRDDPDDLKATEATPDALSRRPPFAAPVPANIIVGYLRL